MVAPITGGAGQTFSDLVGTTAHWTPDGTALVVAGQDKAIRYDFAKATQEPIELQVQNGIAVLAP
jgi:hypothetical protein